MDFKTYIEPVFIIEGQEFKVSDRIKCSGTFINGYIEGNIKSIGHTSFELVTNNESEFGVYYGLLNSIKKVEDTIEIKTSIKIKLGEKVRIWTKGKDNYTGKITKIADKYIDLENECNDEFMIPKIDIENIQKIQISI